MNRRVVAATSLLTSLGLSACLWGASTLGGTLSGLPSGTSVTLQNKGSDNLTLTQNGPFEFAGTVDEGESYEVTVLTQPVGANCTVANGSGTADSTGRDITNVAVTCVANASITGTVSGLVGGTSVTLANSGPAGGTVVAATNGPFAFPGIRPNGEAYNVTVTAQPAGLTCTVADGAGNIVTGTPTNITVTCS